MKTNKQKLDESIIKIQKLSSALNLSQQLNFLLSNYLTNNKENEVMDKLEELEIFRGDVELMYHIITTSNDRDQINKIVSEWIINKRTDIQLRKEFNGR